MSTHPNALTPLQTELLPPNIDLTSYDNGIYKSFQIHAFNFHDVECTVHHGLDLVLPQGEKSAPLTIRQETALLLGGFGLGSRASAAFINPDLDMKLIKSRRFAAYKKLEAHAINDLPYSLSVFIQNGGITFDRKLEPAQPVPPLTLECFPGLARGESMEEMGNSIHRSRDTVKGYFRDLYRAQRIGASLASAVLFGHAAQILPNTLPSSEPPASTEQP